MIDYSKPVRVFKNPKHNCYSIMQGGQIKLSAKQVRLGGAEFKVRESGRQRMLASKRRNVHAYVIGALLDHVHPAEDKSMLAIDGRTAYYNPFQYDSFVDRETETPLQKANIVQLDEAGVTYSY